jgi:methyl-accepting chemotaxis protein
MEPPDMVTEDPRLTTFFQRAHRLALGCLAFHLLVCLAFAGPTGTWGLALGVGLPALFMPAWLALSYPAALLSRLVVAASSMVFTALIIQQTGGDMEAHFSFFVMMSVLVVYCDWRPIVASLLVIAAHHALFTILQGAGTGAAVWNDSRGPWGHFLVHGAVGTVQCVALSYLAVMLNRLVLGSFQVASLAQQISDGRLDNSAPQGVRGEMIDAMVNMQERLRGVVGRVQSAAHSVGGALAEIAQGATDLAARTEASASRTQQTNAEVQAFVNGSRETLAITNQAAQSSREVAQAVGHASQTMDELLTTMKGIDDDARRISDIIGVIDGIAFQTNILALNAAVEAARAGEQGRGFAVVAGEVRSLAQRSAQAAKEVRTLITAAVERAGTGGRLAQDTGSAMSTMVDTINRVGQLVSDAAEATQAGQPRLEALSQALSEIDLAMQGNAAFIEELSATTLALREQEQGLRDAVSVFRGADVRLAG